MLQETQLYWYKILFFFELAAAEGIFCLKLRRRSLFVPRLLLALAAGLAVAVFFPLRDYTVAYNSVIFFSIFFVTLLGLKFCFDESWWNLLFCGVAGYSVQHIAFVAYTMVTTSLNLDGLLARLGAVLNPYANDAVQGSLNPLAMLAYFDCYLLVYWYLGYFLNERMNRNEDLSLGRKPLIAFSGLVIAVDIVLHMVTVMNTAADTTSVLLENFYNLLCGVLALFLQFGVLSRRQLEQDKVLLQQMLAQKEEQYRIRKKSMELLNIKHHDLKHQLHLLRKIVDEQSLKGMEEAVNRYDTIVHTGNESLDLVLTEKSMLCQSRQITFSYMADGAQLNGMEAADIYGLFGSAMENAMEYLQTLAEPDKRFVHLSVKRTGDLVAIHLENYYEGPDRTAGEGLPPTTKPDRSCHGFGLRSIRMTAEKYGGELSVHARDHLFCLDVILPARKAASPVPDAQNSQNTQNAPPAPAASAP